MQDSPRRPFSDIFHRQSSLEQRKLILDDQSDALALSSHKAIARSRDLLRRTAIRSEQTGVETAADAFAAQALKSVLMPAADGLQVFTELAPKRKSPPMQG